MSEHMASTLHGQHTKSKQLFSYFTASDLLEAYKPTNKLAKTTLNYY